MQKPDLRRERWRNGWKGERFACMKLDISEDRLVLTSFDSWSIVLLNGLISDTEDEGQQLNLTYQHLSEAEQQEFRDRNWERAFDLSFLHNSWTHRGDSIQATFWELKKEDIQKVWFFSAASLKPANQESH